MSERRSGRRVRLRALALTLGGALLTAAGGCAASGSVGRIPSGDEGPAPVPLPAPVPVPEALLAAHAELLRLEDRLEFDEAALQRLARDESTAVRARAALAMGRLREPRGAAMLLELLADPDTSVAATAAFSLGQLADSAHAGALAARLATAAESAPTVASEAAYALGKVGGEEARDALRVVLASADTADVGEAAPAVAAALLAIWKLPRLDTIEPIARWLASPDPELRWRAAYALTRRLEPRALPRLRGALDDADDRVRAQAVRGLTAAAADSAGNDNAELIAELAPLLNDDSYEVAINTARTLGSYAAEDAAVPLIAAVRSSRRHLALAAIEALGRVGALAYPAAAELADMASTDSIPPALRAAALESLGRVDPSAAPAIADRLAGSPDWRLRAAAARVFAGSSSVPGGEAVGASLRARLADADPRAANAALQAAIDRAGEDLRPIRPLLIGQLGATDVIVRATALTALARTPDPALLPVLLDAYARAQRDTLNDAALAAVEAIGAIEGDGAAPSRSFLARFSRSDDALVRRRVAEHLDSAAVSVAWGPPLPIETGRDAADYRRLVEQLVAPVLAGGGYPLVAIVTAGDTLVLRLSPVDAPLTVESFLRLADAGYFDGQAWPRVVPNFVVQGGDPRGDTSGGPGYSIRDEIGRSRYGAGALGMALAGPDTGGSQFFITHSPQPHLDGTYAIFGQLVAGRETLERLLPGDVIQSIRSVR